MKNQERIVATIPKGRDVIRVTVRVVDGATFINVRKCRPYGQQMHRETGEGFSLRPDVARSVVAGIMEALAGCGT
jgi:hypothetical protein